MGKHGQVHRKQLRTPRERFTMFVELDALMRVLVSHKVLILFRAWTNYFSRVVLVVVFPFRLASFSVKMDQDCMKQAKQQHYLEHTKSKQHNDDVLEKSITQGGIIISKQQQQHNRVVVDWALGVLQIYYYLIRLHNTH
eukprot:scaffold8938_cov124-Skeletonema_dohrnii-CCMP3373.AAC.8